MNKNRNIGKRLTCILISAAMMLAMAACQTGTEKGGSESSVSSVPESSASNISETPVSSTEESLFSELSTEEISEEDEEGQTLTDQAGRTVEIPSEVNRIVSGYYISSSVCISLGLTEKMVGIEAKAASRPIYKERAPELLDLPNVGSAKEFDLEACIALEPDLVILPKRLADAAETMSGLGIAVVLVNPESTDEMLEMVELIAKAAGVQERAEFVSGYYMDEVEKIESLASQAEAQPIVYMGSNSAYLSTAVGDMYQSELIEKSGGKNAAAQLEGDGWTDISYEQLLQFNPDIIVIPSEASYTKEEVINDSQLAEITAVKDGKVYAMPSAFEAWDSPTLSGALGMAWMLHVLQPELYTLEDLKTDAADFYSEVYEMDIDTSLIEP